MIHITFISHKTTSDNENNIASGWNDVPLSDLGLEQAEKTRKYFQDKHFDFIFCSDLERSYKTGLLVFKDHKNPIIMDWRLRECNYGLMNGAPKDKVESIRQTCIENTYPEGESYADCLKRMKTFLNDLKRYDGSDIVIVGHRATQYALEHLCLDKPLEEVVIAPWSWQEEWKYILK